jgi:hypothetical protein
MLDPQQRLSRAILGDSFHAERGLLRRAWARDVERTRAVQLQPHPMLRGDATGEKAGHRVRDSKLLAKPWTNAPQLIRVVKRPFALSTVSFTKVKAADRKPAPRLARTRLKVELASLRDEGRQPFPMPSKLRYRVEARPRPRTVRSVRSVQSVRAAGPDERGAGGEG